MKPGNDLGRAGPLLFTALSELVCELVTHSASPAARRIEGGRHLRVSSPVILHALTHPT